MRASNNIIKQKQNWLALIKSNTGNWKTICIMKFHCSPDAVHNILITICEIDMSFFLLLSLTKSKSQLYGAVIFASLSTQSFHFQYPLEFVAQLWTGKKNKKRADIRHLEIRINKVESARVPYGRTIPLIRRMCQSVQWWMTPNSIH